MTPDDRIALAERIERRAERIHFDPREGLKSIVPMAEKVMLRTIAQEIRDGSFWENDDD